VADAVPQGHPARKANRRHELRDVNVRALFGIALAMLFTALVIHVVVWWLMNFLAHHPRRPDVSLSPLAQAKRIPPPPRLQGTQLEVSPPLDLAAFRAQEEAQLNSYGWVDKNTGRVRIPIERAKELILQQGLPVTPPPPAAPQPANRPPVPQAPASGGTTP